jgi:hypothetical protein
MAQRPPSLTLAPEWLSAEGVTAPELAATWCRLTIEVGDHTVTQVEDLVAHSTRNSIFCSAYPLAEWIATQWWALRSHVRPAPLLDALSGRPVRQGENTSNGLAAHDLRSAGDGFLWPRLFIVPEGTRTYLSWTADSEPRAGMLRFISAGHMWARPAEVQRALSGFVGAVIARLQDAGVPDTLLEEEWDAITSADADETSYCDVAAAFGFDPYDLDAATTRKLEGLPAVLDSRLVADFAAAADPQRIDEDLSWLTHGLERISHSAGPAKGLLARLRGLTLDDDDSGPPWEIGWRQAREVRRTLRVDDTDPMPLEGLSVHKRLTSSDGALQAVGTGVSGHIEVVIGSPVGVPGGRFVDSRALWRCLHARDQPFLLTTAATFDQRVERAFAAELVAPAAGIAKLARNRGGVVLAADVDGLARRFKASPHVISHQLENQVGLMVMG